MPTFTMRLSDREYEALQAGATVFDQSMADFAREALLDRVAELGMSEEMVRQFQQDQARREAAKATLEQVASELQALRTNAKSTRSTRRSGTNSRV